MAFPPWVNIFGGGPTWPSSVSYISYDLDVIGTSIVLQFPQVATTQYVTAGTINVLTSDVSNTITFPDVTIVSPGYTMWVRNSGSVTLTLLKNDGTLLVDITPGLTWFIQVTDNTTPAGIWFTGELGAGSSSVNPAALAGPGIIVNPLDTTQLATNIIAREFSAGGYVVQPSDRAVLLVWTGGTDTLFLPDIATLLPGFIFYISNLSVGGILTIQCQVTGQLINKKASITCNPGFSFEINAGPVEYYTIGTPLFLTGFSFPDGSVSNPSINFVSDTTSGFSHTYISNTTQALNFSLHGVSQGSFFTSNSISQASFPNVLQGATIQAADNLYVFGIDPTKSRMELDPLIDGGNAINFFSYSQDGSIFTNLQLTSNGYLNIIQGDFERDKVSYLAWMRTMI